MSKTRVFIYGSCVSRDTFEHFDPEQFELVQYVARQSVLSAYTKPVELMAPPTLESRFQQRMVTGDFSSSLRSLLSTHGSATDLVLVDLTDERLGAYLLPDGSMVTRSVELIESGAEQYLPQGTQHIAFGTQQHFEYWSTAMNYIGERVQHHMPQATTVLLDIAWAEWSESGTQTPDSFGLKASEANAIFRPYVQVATQALGAHVVSMDPAEVMSGPHHPWGDAPFHYAEKVYLETVRRLTGTEGRVVWGPGSEAAALPTGAGYSGSNRAVRGADNPPASDLTPEDKIRGNQLAAVCGWLRKELPGHWTKHAVWKDTVSAHDFVAQGITFAFDIHAKDNTFVVDIVVRDKQYLPYLEALLRAGDIAFKDIGDKSDRVHFTRVGMVNEIVDEATIKKLVTAIKKARRAIDQEGRAPMDVTSPALYGKTDARRAFA
ncbi:DUF6270 domain-containing protein [Promicromonospora sp. NPDC090134]|uniref:DUF6270 domain-containing protein n=1 Tax=Promicromonospora sp. NPDC090134 TaxID=3364408 RepID=UPI003823C25A